LILVFSTAVAVATPTAIVAVVVATVTVAAVTITIAIAVAVVTAVLVATTDIKSVTATTVASAPAIVPVFSAAAISWLLFCTACWEYHTLSVRWDYHTVSGRRWDEYDTLSASRWEKPFGCDMLTAAATKKQQLAILMITDNQLCSTAPQRHRPLVCRQRGGSFATLQTYCQWSINTTVSYGGCILIPLWLVSHWLLVISCWLLVFGRFTLKTTTSW
jgi:hypothetical protein